VIILGLNERAEENEKGVQGQRSNTSRKLRRKPTKKAKQNSEKRQAYLLLAHSTKINTDSVHKICSLIFGLVRHSRFAGFKIIFYTTKQLNTRDNSSNVVSWQWRNESALNAYMKRNRNETDFCVSAKAPVVINTRLAYDAGKF
jgi:hypothetical protein